MCPLSSYYLTRYAKIDLFSGPVSMCLLAYHEHHYIIVIVPSPIVLPYIDAPIFEDAEGDRQRDQNDDI